MRAEPVRAPWGGPYLEVVVHGMVRAVALTLAATLGACDAPRGGESHPGADDELREISAPSAEIEPRMAGHVRRMRNMSGEELNGMIPAHRQMADHFLDEMDHEVRARTPAPDSAWVATLDSARADLETFGSGTAAELKARMDAHGARMLRLAEMHRRITGSTAH